jgi:glycosyltransferase involved in cell wall biosynthesis
MKVIALMPVKNEGWILDFTLTCLKDFVDEIIVLEDGSIDESRDICAKHKKVTLYENKETTSAGWPEFSIRQKLLSLGRDHSGTHFVCLDADEIFSYNFLDNLDKYIIKLKKGSKLSLQWLALWKSPFIYRDDNSVWSNNFKDFIVYDDGKINHDYAFLGVGRTPGGNTQDKIVKVTAEDGVVFHYQFVPWQRFQLKQAWYRCSELIKYPSTEDAINEKYSITLDDPKARCSPVRTNWLHNISIPRNIEDLTSNWHMNSIIDYFKLYSAKYFEKLDIWHIEPLREEFFMIEGRYPAIRTTDRSYWRDLFGRFTK